MLDHKGYDLIPSTKRGCKGQTETRVEQACRSCSNIKSKQTKVRDSSLEIIESIIANQNLLNHKILTICIEEDLDKNLTGLIANQLMAKYQRPVLLLNKTIEEETEEIIWSGSGRNYDKSKFYNFKDFLNQSHYMRFAEGHQSAFGAAIADKDLSDFVIYTDEVLKDFDFTPNYKVDYIFNHNDMNPKEILDIANLKSIWGQGVEEPLIAIENIKVHANSIQLMSADKNPTLKITLPNGMSLIKFRSSKEEYDSLYSSSGCVSINIVGKCERNEWNGAVSPQIIVEDYEVIGKTDYYF